MLQSVMAQVFVVVGASNVIAFIIRDLGQPALVGWIIQVHLLPSKIGTFPDEEMTGSSACSSYTLTYHGSHFRYR
jgi:Kef-type K+ transport system membrane component KefB